MAHVLLEQAQCDRLECLRHRGDLGEDVDAVLLVLDHALQAAGLALDAAQPLEVVVLAVDVAVPEFRHSPIIPREGMRARGVWPGGQSDSRGWGTTPRIASICSLDRCSSASVAAMIRLVVSSTSPSRSASSSVTSN